MAAHGSPTVAAILVAAGSGARLGADVPKAFVTVGGRTLLAHASARFAAHPGVMSMVIVAPASHMAQAESTSPARATVVVGGASRQASVAAGLVALGPEVEFVLVHDVARAFVPDAVIDAVIAALLDGAEAVVPVLAIHDTVRRVDADGALAGMLDRSTLVAVQTPQGFRRSILAAAHERAADLLATDDAGLVEAIGVQVMAVPGAEESFKITRPWDLAVAEAVATR